LAPFLARRSSFVSFLFLGTIEREGKEHEGVAGAGLEPKNNEGRREREREKEGESFELQVYMVMSLQLPYIDVVII
jgi:hypothetical protein